MQDYHPDFELCFQIPFMLTVKPSTSFSGQVVDFVDINLNK